MNHISITHQSNLSNYIQNFNNKQIIIFTNSKSAINNVMPYYDNIWYTVSKFIIFTNYKNILQNNFRKKKIKII